MTDLDLTHTGQRLERGLNARCLVLHRTAQRALAQSLCLELNGVAVGLVSQCAHIQAGQGAREIDHVIDRIVPRERGLVGHGHIACAHQLFDRRLQIGTDHRRPRAKADLAGGLVAQHQPELPAGVGVTGDRQHLTLIDRTRIDQQGDGGARQVPPLQCKTLLELALAGQGQQLHLIAGGTRRRQRLDHAPGVGCRGVGWLNHPQPFAAGLRSQGESLPGTLASELYFKPLDAAARDLHIALAHGLQLGQRVAQLERQSAVTFGQAQSRQCRHRDGLAAHLEGVKTFTRATRLRV